MTVDPLFKDVYVVVTCRDGWTGPLALLDAHEDVCEYPAPAVVAHQIAGLPVGYDQFGYLLRGARLPSAARNPRRGVFARSIAAVSFRRSEPVSRG